MSEVFLRVRDLVVEFPLARGTLRALVGLLPRTARIAEGSIELAGQELVGAGEGRLRAVRGRDVSMIFQEPMTALNPVMTVGEQIAEAPQVRLGLGRRDARKRALDLMRRVGIPDPVRRYASYPHELSGGMRQRVMIAIALSAGPRLILCDEPTTALDVTVQDQILKLLRGLQEDLDVALVFVSHDLAVIAQTCSRVAVMYAGQLVEDGEVASVFGEPHHPYTLGLLRAVPDFDVVRETLSSIPGSPPDLALPPQGCRFHPRCAFVREDCIAAPVPLIALGQGRNARCLHHEECAAEARREPLVRSA